MSKRKQFTPTKTSDGDYIGTSDDGRARRSAPSLMRSMKDQIHNTIESLHKLSNVMEEFEQAYLGQHHHHQSPYAQHHRLSQQQQHANSTIRNSNNNKKNDDRQHSNNHSRQKHTSSSRRPPPAATSQPPAKRKKKSTPSSSAKTKKAAAPAPAPVVKNRKRRNGNPDILQFCATTGTEVSRFETATAAARDLAKEYGGNVEHLRKSITAVIQELRSDVHGYYYRHVEEDDDKGSTSSASEEEEEVSGSEEESGSESGSEEEEGSGEEEVESGSEEEETETEEDVETTNGRHRRAAAAAASTIRQATSPKQRPHAKSMIVQFDIATRKEIERHVSASACARALAKADPSRGSWEWMRQSIGLVLKREQASFCGYIFRYDDDPQLIRKQSRSGHEQLLLDKNDVGIGSASPTSTKHDAPKKRTPQPMPAKKRAPTLYNINPNKKSITMVAQVDLKTNREMGRFESATAAGKELCESHQTTPGMMRKQIGKVLRKEIKSYHGYFYKYVEVKPGEPLYEEYDEIIETEKKRRVAARAKREEEEGDEESETEESSRPNKRRRVAFPSRAGVFDNNEKEKEAEIEEKKKSELSVNDQFEEAIRAAKTAVASQAYHDGTRTTRSGATTIMAIRPPPPRENDNNNDNEQASSSAITPSSSRNKKTNSHTPITGERLGNRHDKYRYIVVESDIKTNQEVARYDSATEAGKILCKKYDTTPGMMRKNIGRVLRKEIPSFEGMRYERLCEIEKRQGKKEAVAIAHDDDKESGDDTAKTAAAQSPPLSSQNDGTANGAVQKSPIHDLMLKQNDNNDDTVSPKTLFEESTRDGKTTNGHVEESKEGEEKEAMKEDNNNNKSPTIRTTRQSPATTTTTPTSSGKKTTGRKVLITRQSPRRLSME